MAGVRGLSGMPDRYVVHRIWNGFLECKGEDTKVTPLQVYIHRKINEQCPGKCYVVRYIGANILQIEYDSKVIHRTNWDMVGLLEWLNTYSISIGGRG